MPSARKVQRAGYRVAATACAALSILGVLAYLLTGGVLLQPKATLRVYAPDSSGLAAGSPARINGIVVGKVRSVKLTHLRDPNRVVEIVFTVDLAHLSEIPEDTTAQVSAENVIGDQFLDLSKGKSSRRVRPGGEIRYLAEPELLKTLDLAQFERNLRNVDAMLADLEKGRGRVGEFIAGEKFYEDLRLRIAGVERALRAATAVTGTAGELVYSDRLHRRILEPLRKLDESLALLHSGQGEGGRWLRDDALYQQWRDSLAAFRRAVAETRATSPLVSADTHYSRWSARVRTMLAWVDEVNRHPALSSAVFYEQLAGVGGELRDALREFRQSPEKFMRFKVF